MNFSICQGSPKKQSNFVPNFVVLLTMTINTKNTIDVARNNINNRILDYKTSLSRWSQLPYKVIVVENSGYGNPFKDIIKKNQHIKYVSINLPQIPERGKGYGEAQTLKYAVDNLIKDNNTYIIKFTGRYAPADNLSKILNIVTKHRPNLLFKTGRSEWFVATRNVILNISNLCINVCDDRKGIEGIMETQVVNCSKTIKNVINTDMNIKVIPTYTGGFNLLVDNI